MLPKVAYLAFVFRERLNTNDCFRVGASGLLSIQIQTCVSYYFEKICMTTHFFAYDVFYDRFFY